MVPWPCPKLIRGTVVVLIMAGLGITGLSAQTPTPRPTFDVTRHPDLYFNVWPADVNEDGISDLVAGTRAISPFDNGDVVVALGRGNGTFHPSVPVDYRAVPLTVADFNADGFVEIVILRGGSLEILGGNGDGTFDAARVIDTVDPLRELRNWAHAADMNGDGHRDLIVPDSAGGFVLNVYYGTGALTFGAPIVLPTADGMSASEVTSADFNGDGRRDLALVNLCCNLSIYLNQGSTFSRSDLPGALNDIVAADVNRDGRTDLVGVSGRFDQFTTDQAPGQVHVRLGNGNGTFQAPVSYSVGVRGTVSVVVGDFNADGRLDVATGNRSIVEDYDNGGVGLADSVSVLAGNGSGGFLPAVTHALAYITQGDFGVGFDLSSPYTGDNHQLNTSDLNADGRTDLIASPAAILLNRAPRSNRAPTVFAFPDRAEQSHDGYVDLGVDAADPDMDWLTYRWTDESGAVLSRWPFWRFYQPLSTPRTYTVTVDDGRGGTASDSVTIRLANFDVDPYIVVTRPHSGQRIQAGVPFLIEWGEGRTGSLTGIAVEYSLDDGRTFATVPGCGAVALGVMQCRWASPGPLTDRGRVRVIGRGDGGWISVSGRFAIVAEPALPDPWETADIGAVGARGTASVTDGTWTIEGSGADIWDRADEFRYVYRIGGSQFSLTARVASIENLHRWVKAGIMVREDLSAGARHVSLFATPRTDRGLAFQRRLTPGGLSEHTSGPSIAPPVWLRIGRSGDTVTAYYGTSTNGPWSVVARQVVPGLRTAIYVGLAVSSHVDGTLATARFDNVRFEAGSFLNRIEDVGNVGQPGSTTFDGVVYELQGSGADIWGTADAFHYAYTRGYYSPWSINSISARVRSVENTYPWAKAGVMFRELSGSGPTPEANARHVMVVVTPGRGVAMQYRSVTGGTSVQVAVRPGVAPAFVRLTRSGHTFTGATSADGVTWHQLGQVTLQDLFAEPGLVVTSHDNTTRATATFDEVRVTFF